MAQRLTVLILDPGTPTHLPGESTTAVVWGAGRPSRGGT